MRLRTPMSSSRSNATLPSHPRAAACDEPAINRLLAIMARLRDPETGCPWDVQQDFASIARYTIEEAYEVAEAIADDDMPSLCDELGDLLLQVVFHARIAEERGLFAFDDVVAAISDKMLRRHPHVFGEASVADAAAQTRRWEDHKAEERAAKAAAQGRAPSILDGVTVGLPSLTRAVKLQNRAARVGFDWARASEILDKIEEEIRELRAELTPERPAARREDELGDVLFAIANLARRLDIDPETAARSTNAKFERRFRRIEALLVEQGRSATDASLDDMEALWQVAKAEEKTDTSSR
ncbi:MAG: nucleoside triphosphate pyrophosphohydrolase [Azospirillaceae bacterium]|nr:nucleoside triphosphate pyrophosphohydrolase [Azospirillaceae bacterium]